MPKFTVYEKTDYPHDPARPYYIGGSDYDGFNLIEASTVAAILNERGDLTWDEITADYRWLIMEATQASAALVAENDRLRKALEKIAAGLPSMSSDKPQLWLSPNEMAEMAAAALAGGE